MYNNLRNKIVGYLACVHFISIIVKCFFFINFNPNFSV